MKTEVTMLPNTSRATMPPTANSANDAEPLIARASVRLGQLHVRTRTAVSAEPFDRFSECSYYCEPVKGFTLNMGKAVTNRRSDEPIDLVDSNLWL